MNASLPRTSLGLMELRWLLLSLALAVGMHTLHLAPWISALMLAFGTWRYMIARNGWPMPRLWLLLPMTLAAGLGVLVTYHGLFGRDASVALLMVMLALKLMESTTRRDFVLLVFLGYFVTVNAFLFSQSIAVGAFMLLPLLALTTTLVGVSHASGRSAWRSQLRLAASMLAQALPLMLVLFLLFPRIPGPLWGVPQDAYRGMSGLSDSMEPGAISDLSLSSAVAFRVQFQGSIPPAHQLYWRGPVLWHYDGRSWRMSSQHLNIAHEQLQVSGPASDYTVTLEPHNRPWLLMLDMPTRRPSDTLLSREYQVLSRQPVRTRIRYQASSHLQYVLAPTLSERERELALQIPDDENPRSVALARSWANQSPSQIVQRALQMYRQQPFIYTLSPPRLGVDAMDSFLFDTRRGFCEHYASSFVYLMRAAGVPARVVTGYQGGETNPAGNYLIVRQSDAHAWAEVWLQGQGWLRVDPTAAVAPDRIEAGIAASVADSDALPLLSRRDYPLLRKLYLNWDAVNNGWNQWVLGYDQKRQLELLSRLTGSRLSWQDLAIAMISASAIVVLVISLFLLHGVRRNPDRLNRHYQLFLKKMARRGVIKQAHETPLDFGRRAANLLPALADSILEISQRYNLLRYARHDSKSAQLALEQAFITAVDRLRR